MKKILCALLSVLMMLSMMTFIGAGEKISFSDVKETRWSYSDIMYAVENGYMNGVGENKFDPAGKVTRGMVVTILYRLAGGTNEGYSNRFSDVKAGMWYTDAVFWAAEFGIVNGISETEFAPNAGITREQLAAIIYRFSSSYENIKTEKKADISGFDDSKKVSSYAKDAMAWCSYTGLVTGVTDKTLVPKGSATREQFAAILSRFDHAGRSFPDTQMFEYYDEDDGKAYSGKKCAPPENIVLTAGEQVLSLQKRADGRYNILTYLFDGKDYVSMFDGRTSFVNGDGNSLFPSEYEITGDGKCVLKGINEKDSCPFTITVTADEDSGMLEFLFEISVKRFMSLTSSEIGLSMRGSAETAYSQMPSSIYGDDMFGIGTPSAYLYDSGREAVIIFDYSLTDDTGDEYSFRPSKGCKAEAKEKDSRTFFGLCSVNGTEKYIGPKADFRLKFYLYSGFSEKKTGLDCIREKALKLSLVHPSEVPWPTVREDCRGVFTLDWENVADHTVSALMNGKSFNTVEMDMSDPLLTDRKTAEELYLHYDRASEERRTATDFSCNNNWLSGALLYNRLNGNEELGRALSSKTDALPFYYDPLADMIRYGFRYGSQVGEFEMPWQNFFFDLETYRASVSAGDGDYNPAALAAFLSSLGGITEHLEKNGTLLSQWIHPIEKENVIQQDNKYLGTIYEPWQIGTYAYLLTKAYDITGDGKYLDTAAEALKKVAYDVSFSVSNEVYSKTYTDSAEFPLTEIFGQSYGTCAAYRLYEETGDESMLRLSEDFFGLLMQMYVSYDDNITPEAKTFGTTGLFEPHGGGYRCCPWETIEAYLPLSEILLSTDEYVFDDLILRMFNCERINSLNFFPFTWDECFKDREAYGDRDYFGIPTEPLYTSFGYESGGNNGKGALYMSDISFRNYLMFSAYGKSDDRDIMVLCLNVSSDTEKAVRGAERNFAVYNPAGEEKTFLFRSGNLPAGSYILSSGGKDTQYTSSQLENGITMMLSGKESIRVKISACDKSAAAEADADIGTRYMLGYEYYLIKEEVQKKAEEVFEKVLTGITKEDATRLACFVLTYMTYDDAVNLAVRESGRIEKNIYDTDVLQTLIGLFSSREHCAAEVPEEYRLSGDISEKCAVLSDAFRLFSEGDYAGASAKLK